MIKNMSKHQKNFAAGVGILVIKEGRLLLGKRKNISHSGYLGIPGGNIDIGENITQAGERELEEEVGIIATNSKLSSVTSTYHSDNDQLFFGFCLVVTSFEGNIKNMEPERCEGWGFYDVNDLPENIFAPHQAFIDNHLAESHFSEHTNE